MGLRVYEPDSTNTLVDVKRELPDARPGLGRKRALGPPGSKARAPDDSDVRRKGWPGALALIPIIELHSNSSPGGAELI